MAQDPSEEEIIDIIATKKWPTTPGPWVLVSLPLTSESWHSWALMGLRLCCKGAEQRSFQCFQTQYWQVILVPIEVIKVRVTSPKNKVSIKMSDKSSPLLPAIQTCTYIYMSVDVCICALCNSFPFLSFIFHFYWSRVDLPYCVSFRCTAKLNSRTCTYIHFLRLFSHTGH